MDCARFRLVFAGDGIKLDGPPRSPTCPRRLLYRAPAAACSTGSACPAPTTHECGKTLLAPTHWPRIAQRASQRRLRFGRSRTCYTCSSLTQPADHGGRTPEQMGCSNAYGRPVPPLESVARMTWGSVP